MGGLATRLGVKLSARLRMVAEITKCDKITEMRQGGKHAYMTVLSMWTAYNVEITMTSEAEP